MYIGFDNVLNPFLTTDNFFFSKNTRNCVYFFYACRQELDKISILRTKCILRMYSLHTIGLYYGPSEDCPKVRPKDVIGRDENGPSEDRPKVRPKDVIRRDEDGPSEDCPKVRPKDSDWTKKETCPYDDASDLSS